MHYIGSNQQIVIETVSLKHLCRFWSPQFCLPFFNFSSLFSSHFFSSKKKGPDEGWRTVWRFQNCPKMSKKSKKCQKWGSRILHQNLRFWYTTVFCQKVEKKRSK